MNTNPHASDGPSGAQQITLRSPAELADALPFMLGFHPTDSVVLVGLHGERGRFGGRVRLGIPSSPAEWSSTAEHLAECLVDGCTRKGIRPDGIVVFLCQDPAPGETARQVSERLSPFAQRLRTACGELDIPVYEALCISDGLYFSYCCPDTRCCPPDGTPLALTGTSVMAAAAAYAGIQVRGTLRDMQARLKPREAPGVALRGDARSHGDTPPGTEPRGNEEQRKALNEAAAEITPKLLEDHSGRGRREIRQTTLDLARTLLRRFDTPAEEETADATSTSSAAGAEGGRPDRKPVDRARARGAGELDAADDALLTAREAATLIIGLQDRDTRDQAAAWMEGREGLAALRLWRALARRCVAPYGEHAAAPLALAGWTAWSTGDEPSARVALGLALEADPDYLFARLLHQACNDGLDPESLRSCLREERRARTAVPPAGPVSRPRPRVRRPGGARPRAVRKGAPVASARPGPVRARHVRSGAAPRGGRRGTRSRR
ncbi:DUF4192 domain-containing protein [Streptomyces sp. NPDC006551]|uniref:DUF4192 domain-containing protein n=1 Tax=Streptomyces sp. NPDC006551 TaxID=3157178 RepID=UPI0033BD2F7E